AGNTHFSAATQVLVNTSGVDIPSSSVVVLGSNLLLFDIETIGASEGTIDVTVLTPSVWSDLGAPGYAEQFVLQIEIQQPPSRAYPMVTFVQAGGAVGPDEFTNGEFAVAVEFSDAGGAAIDPATFECVVDRDI